MLKRVTLIIALLLCSALAYRTYLADHSANSNTIAQKIDMELYIASVKKIQSYAEDYQALVSAVKSSNVDPNINLSAFAGYPRTILGQLLEIRGKQPNIEIFKALIEAGVPVRPNSIILASKSKVPTELLSLMLQHLSDSDRNYRYKAPLSPKVNYTYTSYAAQHSTLASLKVILAESLGDKSDAINALLKAKLAGDKKPKALDIEQIAKRNKLFNDKVELLFEHNIPVDPQLAGEVLKNTTALNEQNRALILTASQSTTPAPDYAGDAVLKAKVLEYATALKKAHELWPEFIFSYDADCHKVAANSHYRFDNLIEESVINDLVNSNKTADKQTQINAISKLGDIYADWTIKNDTWAEMDEDKTVKPDRTNKAFNSVADTISSHIASGEWSEIGDILTSNAIPLDYVYSKNAYLVENSLFYQVPQHILFDWINQGVPIRNSTLDDLITKDEYAEFTFELIKNGKLINKSRKSMIFQAARNTNFPLLKLLLNPTLKDESYNHNIGLSALNWTLLNYNDGLKQQLALLQANQQ